MAENQKKYPYLFWEGTNPSLFYSIEKGELHGFIIKTDTAISFLENQLGLIGLNSVERTDFITFWGPILEKNEYALIQFILDDDYENQIAKMDIQPKPDAEKRVFMICSGLTSPYLGMNIVPQTFNSFERKGFTVVEWGGSEINLNPIEP